MFGQSKGDVVADARRAVALVSAPTSEQPEAQSALKRLLEHARRADAAHRDAALDILADGLPALPIHRAAYLALAAGALIEEGADPKRTATPILDRTREALEGALAFVEACETEARSDPAPKGEPNEKAASENVIERYGKRVRERMPEPAMCFGALDLLQPATLAVLSRLREQRKRAHADEALRAAVARLEESCDLECLAQMLRVLDDEEIVVLHPASGRGYLIRIAGIGDNFQLHTLLADALIGDVEKGWLPGERPAPQVAALARNAPFDPEHTPTAYGAFNLLNWYGLHPDGTVDEGQGSSRAWIWNEGVPADIAPFEGTRVILLTPPPYSRSWNAGRFFPAMDGELEVIRQLSSVETRDWLARLASAPHPEIRQMPPQQDA